MRSRNYGHAVHRNPDGSWTFEPLEGHLVRAALFTIEHYMDQVWDETEVHAISAYPVDRFRSARERMDSLVTAEDRRVYTVASMGRTLEWLERFDDEELQGRWRRALRAVLDEARALGVPVSERLMRLAH